MSAAPVPLRPHHVICLLGFEGHGYSDRFTANMAAIAARLRGPGGGATMVEITAAADAICAPCPERRGSGCVKDALIASLDRRHAARLDLAPGDRLAWSAAVSRVRARVVPADLDTLCRGCRWLPLGMCRAAVERLRGGGEG